MFETASIDSKYANKYERCCIHFVPLSSNTHNPKNWILGVGGCAHCGGGNNTFAVPPIIDGTPPTP